MADDIATLISNKKFPAAQAAIAAARRGGEISGSDARALGKALDTAQAKVPVKSKARR